MKLIALGLTLAISASPSLSYALVREAVETATPAEQTADERRLAELQIERQIAEQEQLIRKANADLVPTSGVAGTVEIKEGGGGPEVLAIAADQFSLAARQIISKTDDPGGRGLWIATGTSRPDTSIWQMFKLRQAAVQSELLEWIRAREAEQQSSTQSLAPSQAMDIAAVFGAATALLSYARSDFSVAGVAVSGLDDAALAAAVIGAGTPHIQLLQTNQIQDATLVEVEQKLRSLDMLRQRLDAPKTACEATVKARDDAVEAANTEALKAAARARYASQIAVCDELTAKIAVYDSFVAAYRANDGVLMQTVIRQADLFTRLCQRDLLLVDLHQVAGAGYTQTNLVSHLGGMPYHVTTSSVVSWQRLNTEGRLVSGGFEPFYFGYRRLGEVAERLGQNCDDRGECVARGPATFNLVPAQPSQAPAGPTSGGQCTAPASAADRTSLGAVE